MAIIVLQHTATEGPGRLGVTLRDHGQELDVRRLDLPVGGLMRNRHVPTDFDGVDGVISLGGPMNVGDNTPWMNAELEFLKAAHERKVPLVGICLGAQMIAKALGGEVAPMAGGPEWGIGPVTQLPIANTEIILAGIAWRMWQFHSHGHEVSKLPPGSAALQFSSKCKVQSFRAGLRTYGFQYHFECDMAAIVEWLRSGDTQIAHAGITDVEGAIREAKAHYEEYARLSDRICVNLATYLFKISKVKTA
jgi:GMP synthase (glutamine-hydrolysing)